MVARPCAQSAQLAALMLGAAKSCSEPWRHVPALTKAQQAGSVGVADARSTTISSPDVAGRSVPRMNVPMRTPAPVFEVQAKFLFSRPPSLKHSLHRMPTPAADATEAVRARSRPHSRVTLFIVCLRNLFTERGWGVLRSKGLSERSTGRAHVVCDSSQKYCSPRSTWKDRVF